MNIDHRRRAAFAPGDLTAYIRAAWDLGRTSDIYIEAVHRLSNLGAVVTHAAHGTSQEGFDAEWRMIDLLTVDGDLISRCEMFDEADLDAALARFEELSRPTPRLENAASQAVRALLGVLRGARLGRRWPRLLADDMSSRRSPSGGERRDPTRSRCRDRGHAGSRRRWVHEHHVDASSRPAASASPSCVSPFSDRDQRSEAFRTEALSIVEIDADGRIAALVMFDPDDIDAAFEELDARYLAGEAAAHAQTWSVIAEVYAAFNRRELPATTPDWVNIDHRRLQRRVR